MPISSRPRLEARRTSLSGDVHRQSMSQAGATPWLSPADQFGNPNAHFIRRISILLFVLVAELLLVRAWLNVNSLQGTDSLTTILARRGPGTLRFVVIRFLVAFAMFSLVF